MILCKMLYPKTKNLYFRYSKKNPYIIKNLNIKIHRKEILEIIGVNGQGKVHLYTY